MRRVRRLVLPAALLLVAALVWWALAPSPLTAEERGLVGRWRDERVKSTVDVRADRAWWQDGEYAGRWRVRGGVLRVDLVDYRVQTAADRLLAAFDADRPALVYRLAWDGPDRFRLHADVLDRPQPGQDAVMMSCRRLP